MIEFSLLSGIVTLAALFGLLSHRVLRLPTTIGATMLSLAGSALLLVIGHWYRAPVLMAADVVRGIDFNHIVLHGMLAFLLFSGALQVNLEELFRQKLLVFSLSVAATLLSTGIVAVLFRWAVEFAGIDLGWTGALLFGALISPTDPIAVLEMLRRVGAPAALEAQLAGESLFNDGVGAVLFLVLLGGVTKGTLPGPGRFALDVVLAAGGGALLGIGLGYLTYRLLCTVDSYRIEVMLTLALAMGGYALADALHVSAPIEAVTAGLLVSGGARMFAMSEQTQQHVDDFWEIVDDIFNVVLFFLMGLELLVLPMRGMFLVAGLIAIPVVLLARLGSVTAVLLTLRLVRHSKAAGTTRILTWGGLRGGLAVALALSLPASGDVERNLLLATTYVVVVFSILVQGLTIDPLIRRLGLPSEGVAKTLAM